MMLKLYGYWRSSASYRVRIALHLKNLSWDNEPIHLLRNGGEQHSESFSALNPMELVPVLEHDQQVISQSLAIIQYLDEMYPLPALLPDNSQARAEVMSMALGIACDTHPLNNLRVLQYLKQNLGAGDADKESWYAHWVGLGFDALEQQIKRHRQSTDKVRFCYGQKVSLADICLIPQVYNAIRFSIDISRWPAIEQIYHHCNRLPAFINAAPERQPDAS